MPTVESGATQRHPVDPADAVSGQHPGAHLGLLDQPNYTGGHAGLALALCGQERHAQSRHMEGQAVLTHLISSNRHFIAR